MITQKTLLLPLRVLVRGIIWPVVDSGFVSFFVISIAQLYCYWDFVVNKLILSYSFEAKEQPLVFKSSEDILKQWRLRRKIEESRSNAVVDTNQREIAIFDPESFALRETTPSVYRNNNVKPSGIEIEQKKEETKPPIANIQEKCTSFEISTQTCSVGICFFVQ
jgi:hypothetical protein